MKDYLNQMSGAPDVLLQAVGAGPPMVEVVHVHAETFLGFEKGSTLGTRETFFEHLGRAGIRKVTLRSRYWQAVTVTSIKFNERARNIL